MSHEPTRLRVPVAHERHVPQRGPHARVRNQAHHPGKADRPTIGTGQEGYSFLWQDQCTRGLSDERLLDMIIDLAVPWFVNFYVSWYRLCEQRAVDALWVTYEQLFAEKEKTLRQVLEFVGVAGIPEIDPEILSRQYPTYRDGSIGQGATLLTAEQGS